MRPLRSIQLIAARLSAVSVFVNPNNDALAATLRTRLGKVKDITVVLCKIRKVSYSVADWKSLFDSIANGAMIVHALRSSQHQAPFFEKVPCYSSAFVVHQVFTVFGCGHRDTGESAAHVEQRARF
jgi:DNA mismatch repair ATPase MutS